MPASSGYEDLTQLSDGQRLTLLDQVDSLDGDFDVLLIDTGAGISANVLFFATAAQETLVVVTPEPTSLTDAYALIKVLSTRYAEHSFSVLVNMARSEFEARKTFTQLTRVAERFLQVNLRWAGYVPYDSEVPEAVRRQQAVIELGAGRRRRPAPSTASPSACAPRRRRPRPRVACSSSSAACSPATRAVGAPTLTMATVSQTTPVGGRARA